MSSTCLFCGKSLDTEACFGRRNFCRYETPDCLTEYNNMMRSLAKAKVHPNESIQKLARLLTDRELRPLKPIKYEWIQLTRKKQPSKEMIAKIEKTIQIIYAVKF